MARLNIPNSAPFAPEQIAALDQAIGGASAVQRAWLSGFLAGLDAAEGKTVEAPAPALAPAEKPKLLVLYATESGNAEALATRTRQDAAKRGFAARVLDMADADIGTLAGAGTVLAIVSTWGDGEPPQRAAPFYRALMGDAAPRLEGVSFAVLALGDSSYAQFCETGRLVDERLAALGAKRAVERIDLDLDYEAAAKTWLTGALEALAPKEVAPGSVIHVDFQKAAPVAASKTAPFAAEIGVHHKLTSERADGETFHLELALAGSGLTYEPGDALGVVPRNDPALVDAIRRAAGLAEDAALVEALTSRHDLTTLTARQVKDYAALSGDAGLAALDDAGRAAFIAGRQWIDLLEAAPASLAPEALLALLRPLAPRYYSIASSQKLVGEEAHLTVARLAYESAGRPRLGVASGLIADRRRGGDKLDVFVRANPHFRLPKDEAAPVVMIGAGTGIAPYRGFLQEREATGAKGESWLIFGHRHFLYDFLYQLEIQDWLKSGVLSRLDLASSRDQPEKRYVQHVLWDRREALRRQLEEGATLYLCGDAKHMAHDVEAVLRRILADGRDEAAGAAALDALISAGRYKKDVY